MPSRTQEKPVSEVKLFKPAGVEQKYNDRGTSWHEFVNEKDNSPLASGITYLRDSDFDWTLWYDEMMICIDPGQLLEVTVDGRAYSLARGESIWLPKGTVARYRSVGLALMYYAISPADWRNDARYARYAQSR
ncbi:MAG: hypothetical protein EOS25_20305 [Mesorhizobium sp.]|nr:MAG: hypothetical protein EOS59_13610 [Mesorhizobium sp.]RWE58657.1 MAG: hypothetical protein EOS24_16745 [Mesorhizobium sp.]RWF09058.1 MAG: hypothetical protein EOS69_20890 [Mesorhizobium sp.]RWF16405.1 MAG: hypothetical protein EOS25_20305 [Mesorhizobium sp.]TIY01202.1 MAG: hypothetical protein E5V22_22055 [Mesorhizobium sp.]